jgi:hypothetical protein
MHVVLNIEIVSSENAPVVQLGDHRVPQIPTRSIVSNDKLAAPCLPVILTNQTTDTIRGFATSKDD